MTQPAPDPMLPMRWRIDRVRKDTADTFTLTLTPADAPTSMGFAPGQFNMLYVFGVGEVAISISGNPAEPGTLRHTVRAVGTVTKAMADLRRGDVLGVRGPFGTAWPTDTPEGADVLLVAGGIGLAPLRPALYSVLARRKRYGRVILAYGTRSPADLLYRAELARWQARDDLDVLITVDRAVGAWPGRVGVVPSVLAQAPFEPSHTVAMLCGPEVMMRFSVQELQRRGMRPDQIHLSLERNMKCAVGFCGHCQLGPEFVCRDGPVFPLERVARILALPEI